MVILVLSHVDRRPGPRPQRPNPAILLFPASIRSRRGLDCERHWPRVAQAPLLVSAIAGFIAAAAMNRAGKSDWAGRTAFVIVLLSAILLVFQAHDGFRSHS